MKRLNTLLKSRKTEIFLVAVILLTAIFVRAYHFGAPPIGVHQDEAMAAVDAKALAEYGTDRYGMRYPVHFTAWKNSQMSVCLSYCMVPFIKMLGFSTVTIRLPLLITSCLGLLALYLFTRQLAGKWTAIIALLFGMICPWHYMQSRWSIDCNMFPHMFLFAVCFLLTGLHRIEGKKWNRVFLYVSMCSSDYVAIAMQYRTIPYLFSCWQWQSTCLRKNRSTGKNFWAALQSMR